MNWNFVTMCTALFVIIIANIVYAFNREPISFSSKTKTMFVNLSTVIITYAELKDVSSLTEPSYINQLENIENKVFSPMNIYMLMSLLLNGAKEGSTEKELKSFLNIPDKIALNKYIAKLSYLNGIKDIELHLGTAVYVQNSVELTADFLSICINRFNCSISRVDFNNNAYIAENINAWIQKTTNYKMLDQIISPVNINKDTKIMLVNIVYVNNRWLNLTYKKGTEEYKFFVSPSKMYSVPTMKFEKSTFSYGEIPHWNAKFFEIPFSDNNITMIIFMPNEKMEPWNLKYLEKKINFAEFKTIRSAYTNKLQRAAYLYLPKFTSEYTQNITDFFRQKGVNTMFENNADLTHLSKIPLKINNIVQTVSVKINEGSLEVPIKIVRSRVRKLPQVHLPQKLIIDRPFYYLIEVHGEIMFAGTVRAPDFIFMKDEL